MEAVANLFSKFLDGIRAAVGLVLPIFADAADFRNWPGWLRTAVAVGLVAAICVGLYLLQPVVGLDYYLRNVNRSFARFFLPVLFLLLVAFSWLAYGLWRLLTAERAAGEFPDIAANWAEAVRRLDAGGMKIGDAPLFLMLGRPAAGLDALFLAAGVKDIIRTPSQGEPAVRVYAWDEAIFVVCPGASAWGKFCFEAANPADGGGWGGGEDAGANANKTIGAGGFLGGADPLIEAEMKELVREAGRRDLTPPEAARLRELTDQLAGGPAPARRVSLPDDERARLTRRLRFLCKLIRRERRPWCPLNGVLVVVPWAATETDDAARLGCGVLEQELSAAREVFQLRYPTFALVTDLETARGFDEFRSGFRADMLKQRIGQRVPLVPAGKPDEVAGLVGDAARWIGLSVLPAWILRFLKLESGPDARATPGTSRAHNRNLYLLMRSVFDRGPRLAEVLARGVPPVGGPDDLADVPMFGGCYLAGTGREGRGQAFVPGVFERVLESQNAVSWSPRAEAEDARLNRLAALGYVAVAVLTAAAVAAAYWLWRAGK